jgi:hypothetical protein
MAGRPTRFAELAGMPPSSYKGGTWDGGNLDAGLVTHKKQPTISTKGKGERRSSNTSVNPTGFNMKAVLDVLSEHGLNPTEEIAKILKAQRPLMNPNGTPKLDDDGNPIMVPVLDERTRLSALMSLQEFVAPKLKAVEMTQKEPPLSEDQLDARIARFLGGTH